MRSEGTSDAMAEPKLLDRMRALLRTRHYSIRTEDAYVQWARRFILFHGRKHPSAMGAAELLYGTGMRLLECLRLRVKDLDFETGEVVRPRRLIRLLARSPHGPKPVNWRR